MKYLERLHNIKGKFQTGYDDIVAVGDGDDWDARINSFTKKDLMTAK